MNIPVNWAEADLFFLISIANITLGFLGYLFLSHSPSLLRYFQQQKGREEVSEFLIPAQRYIGFVLMGLLPLAVWLLFLRVDIQSIGLGNDNFLLSLLWAGGIALVVVSINYFNARKPKHLEVYPMIRNRNWSYELLAKNIFSWALYLLGYEMLFRGMFLFPLVESIGFWPAIALNTSLYAFAHIHKGVEEVIGSIPFGIILCLLALQLGNFWVAFFAHLALALSNDLFSLKYHPTIRLTRSQS